MFRRKIRRSREWKKNNPAFDFDKARELRKQNREALANPQAVKSEKSKKASRRWRIKKSRKRSFYSALMVLIIAVIGISVFNVISVNGQLAEAVAGRDSLLSEKERLSQELQNVDNDEYIEQQARMMLKMIKPGEIYYVVPEETE